MDGVQLYAPVQATRALVALAERHAAGRLLVTGGGGYNRANLAAGWTAVLEALLRAQHGDPCGGAPPEGSAGVGEVARGTLGRAGHRWAG